MQRRALFAAFLALSALLVDAPAGAADDDKAIAVIVHPKGPAKKLDRAELAAIFKTKRRKWKGGGRIIALNLPAKSGSRVAFDKAVLGMSPKQVARFWIDRRVRGGARPPKPVPSAAVMVKVVAKLKRGIGFVPLSKVKKGVRVVGVIRKGKLEKK